MAPSVPRSGDAIFANVERVNAELFTLTYGAIVRQLLTDLEEVEEVNKQLDQMGYNIGIRLIDEFLAKSNVTRCVDFRETAEVIAKVGFKMFLGVTASVTNWDTEGTCCSLILEDNPLVDFVELPDTCQGLYYCNILSGVVRGALEMVSMKTEVTWIRDMLRGDDAFELQVKLLKQVPEEYPYKDDEWIHRFSLLGVLWAPIQGSHKQGRVIRLQFNEGRPNHIGGPIHVHRLVLAKHGYRPR